MPSLYIRLSQSTNGYNSMVVSRHDTFQKGGMTMTIKEFLKECTACGGNWVAMLISGIEKVFPEEHENVVNEVERIGFGNGGIDAFAYVCEWLTEHGIIAE